MAEEKPNLTLHKFPKQPPAAWLEETPLEYLEELVAQKKAGAPLRGVLIFFIDDQGKPHIWRKGVGISEQISFGNLLIEMGLKEWREG